MKSKLIIILSALLVAAIGIIAYQNLFSHAYQQDLLHGEIQLYTCGMHPEIISDEPGYCPICEMKLTPIKNIKKTADGERKILYWKAPMDPNEIYNSPGKSNMGMDLVPVYEDEVSGGSVVSIDPEVQQNMNIKFYEIKIANLSEIIETNGIITEDERREYIISSRVGGWIEKLYSNFEGQAVDKNDILLEIYSPELVSAQQEYLTSLSYNTKLQNASTTSISSSGDQLVKNSYKKLRFLEMSEFDIKNLETSGEVKTNVSIYSPTGGIIMKKNVVEGEKITKGQTLLEITDLTNLWMLADIYESEISKVKPGAKVDIYINSFPGKTYQGKVSFIYPTLDPVTRTVKVRIEISNKKLELKPSMLARVVLHGKRFENVPVIPENAIIRSGSKSIAVVSLGDGKFKPVEITTGLYTDGFYQVLSGLQVGNEIVTSAQFLIDSESSLKSVINQFSNSNESDVRTTKDKNQIQTEPQESITYLQDSAKTSPLVRYGLIYLKKIDKNEDGRVFQDPMDWNVISDEPGRCPLCEMKLMEVTLNESIENLKKHGYEVKEIDITGDDHSKHQHIKAENEYGVDSPLIKTGIIDLESIDENNDGKLFQNPMDWNIISDEFGRCPVCEMNMKEVTLNEAKQNLLKHGYQVK